MMLKQLLEGVQPLQSEAMAEAKVRLDSLVKPIGSLGRLEEIAIQIAGITGKVYNKLEKKCIVIMSADNGICEEGVACSPAAVTAIHTVNFTKGLAGINLLARFAKSDIRVVDIGINAEMNYPGIIDKKVRYGTANFAKEAAMTPSEVDLAIRAGIDVVEKLCIEGYQIIGTGEMGIGNTTSSSAILMALTGCSADVAVGRGAGLTEESYRHKKEVIVNALAFQKPDSKDPLDVLAKVGGLDIAGLVGCYVGAAINRVPIVIDGFISAIAALIAYKLDPRVKEFMIPSHASAEPGYNVIMKELGLSPILLLDMRLGEGTGCPLVFNIIDAAMTVTCDMATFEEASIVNDFLIDIRE